MAHEPERITMAPACSELHVVLGTGPLARATASALLARDKKVRLVNRSGTMQSIPQGVELIGVDITARPEPAFSGATTVYFCAQPAYHLWGGLFPALQAAAVEGAMASGARFVAAENLYGYGPQSSPLTEDMPMHPSSIKGRIRAEMHVALMDNHARGRLDVAVARGSEFFGPFVNESLVGSRMMHAIAGGRTVATFGNPDTVHTYTFVQDFGTALAVLGTDDRASGQVWHVPNAPAVSTRRFVELGCALAEKSAKLRRMSVLEMRLLGLFIPAVRESIEMLYEFEQPMLVDDSKFVSRFGNHATPLESALAQTLKWASENVSGNH